MKKATVYISEEIDKAVAEELSKDTRVVFLKPYPALPARLASHADMLLATSDDAAFCFEGYRLDGDLVRIKTVPGEIYPDDVPLNCTFMGSRLIANPKTVSPEIIEYSKRNDITVIEVKQGYAGCAVCKVDDGALITADGGIASAASKAGIDVLEISPGGIYLPGYDQGFIGGASASLPDRIVFFGDVMLHPDGERIADFIGSHGKKCIFFPGIRLTDAGGARLI